MLSRITIEPGRIWIKYNDLFEFNYIYPKGVVEQYVSLNKKGSLSGKFIEYVDEFKKDFAPAFSTLNPKAIDNLGEGAYVSPYAVIKGNCTIGKNALVAQRAHVENSYIGEGANAQENCYIMNSVYEGFNVTAHGGKVINTRLGKNVFVGFNSFVHGTESCPITVGKDSIVMPHTIIDAEEPIEIPEKSAVWGYIAKQSDLDTQCATLEALSAATEVTLGNMVFKGDGKAFVKTFKQRIEHILEENGASYDGTEETRGHAQKTQKVAFNILQPFQAGEEMGMYPDMTIG